MNNINPNNLPGPAIGEIVAMIDRRDKAKELMEQAIDLIAQAQRIAPQYAYESALGNSVSWYSDCTDKNKDILPLLRGKLRRSGRGCRGRTLKASLSSVIDIIHL